MAQAACKPFLARCWASTALSILWQSFGCGKKPRSLIKLIAMSVLA